MPSGSDARMDALRGRFLREQRLTLDVKVIPRAAASQLAGFMDDGVMKVKIAAAPEKGKANEELRQFLGRLFEAPPGKVEILSGETSQRKRVRITS